MNLESIRRLRRILSLSTPAVFDGKDSSPCREIRNKGDVFYTGIAEISIGNPGPIVEESVIFFK